MQILHVSLTKSAIWTIASYCVNNLIRISTSIILTRLLAPELFGIMVIVSTLRTCVELISDVGIGQSIIYNKNAENPDFYNTAWTLKSVRGVLLWLVTCVAAVPLAYFYHTPILAAVIPVASIAIVLSGFTSISGFLLQKRLQIAKYILYDISLAIIAAVGQITLAYLLPTIWGLVLGMLFSGAIVLIWSFFVVPEIRHRFKISRSYAREILHFGKWIFLASIVYLLSTSFDRFYLAGAIPLALLGVYGIARSLSELVSNLALQLGNIVVFPYIAGHSEIPRDELYSRLVSIRLKFLLIAALGISLSAASVDLLIKTFFDPRYHAAGWMTPILIMGAWVSILCSLNESTLLGLGTPRYGAVGYSMKFVWLLIGLPLSLSYYGLLGGVIVIAASDVFRYPSVFVGQIWERFAFGRQDFLITMLVLGLFLFFELLRSLLGFGTSFENLLIFS